MRLRPRVLTHSLVLLSAATSERSGGVGVNVTETIGIRVNSLLFRKQLFFFMVIQGDVQMFKIYARTFYYNK